MPFDGLPAELLSDLAKLRVALDGVRDRGWSNRAIGAREIGGRPPVPHCTIGWLLVATDWDRDETTRLALDYVYPALPEKARNDTKRMWSISKYNDGGSRKRVVKLLEDAVSRAEQQVLG
jgi:hypothetical protein